jgi:hypothetical protein
MGDPAGEKLPAGQNGVANGKLAKVVPPPERLLNIL